MFNVQLYLRSKEKNVSLSNYFDLDFQDGIIAANSQIDVGITFSPVDISNLDVELVCQTKERPFKETLARGTADYAQVKCVIPLRAKGSYPLLKIVDVRNDSISVATLWENMNVNRINKALSLNLDDNEKKYQNIGTFVRQKP